MTVAQALTQILRRHRIAAANINAWDALLSDLVDYIEQRDVDRRLHAEQQEDGNE